MNHRGVFIALEGIDGSGKSGVAAELGEALRIAGHEVTTTLEPGGTEEGVMLRKALLSRDAFDWTPMAELLLVNASRRQHIERVVTPSLEAGKIVICDRFVGSTLAYQGGGRGIPQETILALHRLTNNDLWPDLTLVLDVSPEIGLGRSRARLDAQAVDEGRFEALALAFHERVRQSFLDQALRSPASYRVIDASRSSESVKQETLECVTAFLAGRPPL